MRDSQRLFLRSLMFKQFLSEKETKTLYQKACGVFGGKRKRFINLRTLQSRTCARQVRRCDLQLLLG